MNQYEKLKKIRKDADIGTQRAVEREINSAYEKCKTKPKTPTPTREAKYSAFMYE